jgi:hypothetical protein
MSPCVSVCVYIFICIAHSGSILFLFVCICLNYLCVGHDVLSYVNVRNTIYSLVLCYVYV